MGTLNIGFMVRGRGGERGRERGRGRGRGSRERWCGQAAAGLTSDGLPHTLTWGWDLPRATTALACTARAARRLHAPHHLPACSRPTRVTTAEPARTHTHTHTHAHAHTHTHTHTRSHRIHCPTRNVFLVLLNTRSQYARGASPSGPVTWSLAEALLRNIRWREQPAVVAAFNGSSELLGGGLGGTGGIGGALWQLVWGYCRAPQRLRPPSFSLQRDCFLTGMVQS